MGTATYCCNSNPCRQEEARILGSTSEEEDPGCKVAVQGVDGQKSDEGGLGGVVKQPVNIPLARAPQLDPSKISVLSSITHWAAYHLLMRQSVKKNERYAEAPHCSQIPKS